MNLTWRGRITGRMEFDELLVAHKGILYRVCSLYCRNEADREDLAQEIVIQLWLSFGAFDAERRFSTWMYRIALNVAISFVRREGRRTARFGYGGEALLEMVAAPGEFAEMRLLTTFTEGLGALDKALLLLLTSRRCWGFPRVTRQRGYPG